MKRTSKPTDIYKSPHPQTPTPDNKVPSRFKRAKLRGGKNFEQNLAIGAITDTEFLREVKEDIEDNLRIIQNKAIRQILIWCLEHYERYGKAPHLNIQDVFEAKREDLRPAEEDILEEFLFQLSRKYEEMDDFDASFEIEQVRRGLRAVRIGEEIKQALKELNRGNVENAEDIIKRLRGSFIETPGSISEALRKTLLFGEEALRAEGPNPPRPMLWPWLTAGSIVEIFSARGVGKTFLGCMLAVALTRKNYDSADIGPWRVEKPCEVLMVDGEMGLHELRKRILRLAAPLGPEMGVSPLVVFSAERFSRIGEGLPNVNIARPEWRNTLYKFLEENRRTKLLILDNLSALTPGLDENFKRDWDPIAQWLISIRHLGVSTIFMHHSGKGGDQRGTSGREDIVDCVIRLTKPPGHKWGDPCSFNVSFGKVRNLPEGAAPGLRTFNVTIDQVDEHGNLGWRTNGAKNETEMRKDAIVALLIDGEMKRKEIAKVTGCKPPYVSDVARNWARRKGLLGSNGEPTRDGHRWRDTVDLDAVLAELGSA